MKKLLFVFGTRPEAIKMAPIIHELQNYRNEFDVRVCVTAQHRLMLDQVLNFFNIKPDIDLDLMEPNQNLTSLSSKILVQLENVFEKEKPDLVLIQGDTTSVLFSAIAAFYKKIKIGHVEAGLRSFDKYSPFPEEMNRLLTSRLADLHFAPTEQARKSLQNENITENITVTGNTVIDALFLGLKLIEEKNNFNFEKVFSMINENTKIILVTCHRRESFGSGVENIFIALREIAKKNPNCFILFPVHLNPNIKAPAEKILSGVDNIKLMEPLEYPALIYILSKCYLVLTDSGGLQEEAPSLGKPVLVLRVVTERMEGITAGTSILVGTDKDKIISETERLLLSPEEYKKMSLAINPYGDGKASSRIIEIVRNYLN